MPKFIDPAAAIDRVLGNLFREKRFRLRKVVPPYYYVYTRVGNTMYKLGFDFHWVNESRLETAFEPRSLRAGTLAAHDRTLVGRYKHSFEVWLGANETSANIANYARQLNTGFTTQEELEERLYEVRRALEESGLSYLERVGSSPAPFC